MGLVRRSHNWPVDNLISTGRQARCSRDPIESHVRVVILILIQRSVHSNKALTVVDSHNLSSLGRTLFAPTMVLGRRQNGCHWPLLQSMQGRGSFQHGNIHNHWREWSCSSPINKRKDDVSRLLSFQCGGTAVQIQRIILFSQWFWTFFCNLQTWGPSNLRQTTKRLRPEPSLLTPCR